MAQAPKRCRQQPQRPLLTRPLTGFNWAVTVGDVRTLALLCEVLFASVSCVILEASQWQGQMRIGGSLILLAPLLSVIRPAQHD